MVTSVDVPDSPGCSLELDEIHACQPRRKARRRREMVRLVANGTRCVHIDFDVVDERYLKGIESVPGAE